MEDIIKITDKRRTHFFIIDNDIIDYFAKKLDVYALSVYFSLVRHANEDHEAWPSQQTIAEELNISRDTVNEKTKILEKYGLISVSQSREEKTGEFLHNVYTILDLTVPGETDMDHAGLTPNGFEANTVPGETDTNNTHIIKNTHQEKEDIKLNPDFQEYLSVKRERKLRPKIKFGNSNRSSNTAPNFEKRVKGGVADGRNIK